MGKIAFAAMFAACFVASSPGWAADLSLKDLPDEEYRTLSLALPGFYAGVHGGYGWGSGDVTDVYDYGGDPRADNTVDSNGFIAGVQVGYNIQRGSVVLGIEGDLGYLNLSGSKSADLPAFKNDPENALSAKYTLEGGLYGDLTGRLGYATGRTLLYAKGGVAFLNASLDADYTGANCTTTYGCFGKNQPKVANPSTFAFESDETLVGWTVGVGAEYALTSSLSLKVEYQHFDFGSMSNSYGGKYNFDCKFNGGTCTSELTGKTDTDVTVDAVKIGLNYRFDSLGDSFK
jgi:outer membrane immunogenic protein